MVLQQGQARQPTSALARLEGWCVELAGSQLSLITLSCATLVTPQQSCVGTDPVIYHSDNLVRNRKENIGFSVSTRQIYSLLISVNSTLTWYETKSVIEQTRLKILWKEESDRRKCEESQRAERDVKTVGRAREQLSGISLGFSPSSHHVVRDLRRQDWPIRQKIVEKEAEKVSRQFSLQNRGRCWTYCSTSSER